MTVTIPAFTTLFIIPPIKKLFHRAKSLRSSSFLLHFLVFLDDFSFVTIKAPAKGAEENVVISTMYYFGTVLLATKLIICSLIYSLNALQDLSRDVLLAEPPQHSSPQPLNYFT